MALLNITNGAFKVDGIALLGPLNLELNCIQTTVILGVNGAGKSLFLSMCHGILDGASGSVTWDGAPAMKTRQKRGFMAQQTAVLRRSVFENVEFVLKAQSVSRGDRRERVLAALHAARLDHKAHVPAAALSGGERRRMAMARALVSKPDVILMDEPSSGLDPASTFELEALVGQVRETGTGVIMVSHNLTQAQRLADHVLFMDGGAILEDTAAAEFFAGPTSSAAKAYFRGDFV